MTNYFRSILKLISAPNLKEGMFWNLLSFIMIGLSGILMNYVIATNYEPSVLGSFNQVLVIYLLSAQLSTFGVHYSTLYRTSIANHNEGLVGRGLTPALALVLTLSIVVVLALWTLNKPLTQLFGSEAVGEGLLYILPGSLVFPMNKVFLANLNGLRRMRAYAVGNAARYVLILIFIIVCGAMNKPGVILPIAISAAEIILWLGLVVVNIRYLNHFEMAKFFSIWNEHFVFGAKSMASGLLVEINTKVDVLVLGILSDDTSVGIYSIASVFAEGFLQIMMILRYNYDPLMAKIIHERRWEDLKALVSSGKKLGYTIMLGIGIFAVCAYPLVLQVFKQEHISISWAVFAILTLGIVVSAGYLPFGGILAQGGYPLSQSMMSGLLLTTNMIGNILLIPIFGVIGSAMATAISQALFPIFLKYLTRRNLGFQI